MEQLNHIELIGIVGNIRMQRIGESNVANFSLVTNLAYRSKNGNPVIESTWHNITAWENRDIKNLSDIRKGSKIHLTGRLRYQRFTGADGFERTQCDIIARSLELINTEEALSCQS